MGAVWSAFRRVPGPRSRYYAEVAKYMNLKEALESLPKDRKIQVLRQLGASDHPNWDSVDIVVETLYLLLMFNETCFFNDLADVLKRNDYPFCQRMVLYTVRDYLKKEEWQQMTNNLAESGNPYAQLATVGQERENGAGPFSYPRIEIDMDWKRNPIIQKVDEHFVDLRDVDHHGPLSDLVIDPEDYLCVRLLAAGSHGDVNLVIHRGTMRGYVMKYYTRSQDSHDYMHELNRLATLNHPCVIKLKGFALPVNGKPGVLLLPYYYRGSLDGHIWKLHHGPDVAKIFVGLMIGMRCLHGEGIIHRDLRPENILIDDNGYPVISGLVSSVLEEEDDPENRIQHIPHYQAPEMYHSGPWNGKVDVFSFSAIMYELITKKRVFQETDPKRIQEQCECGERLSIRDSPSFERYHPVVIDIIEKGLSVNPEERYSFEEIYEKMRQVDFMVRKDSRASDHTLELVSSDGVTRDSGGCLLI